VARRLGDVPTIGVVAVALTAVALVVAPLAWFARPEHVPPATTLWAMLGLAVVCTCIAFIVFFALIAEIGPARATLITFVNPAVAVILGAVVLGESVTAATIGGFALVLTGCWLATRPGAVPAPEIATAVP
jgi:drug/metabolite transporter (DMT)-like permease